LSRDDVQILAFKLAQKLGIKHRFCVAEGRAGKDWSASFMRRYLETSVREAEGISLNTVQEMNKEDTPKQFDLLKKTLMENDSMKKPRHIFNLDETGLELNKPGHAVAKKCYIDVHLLISAEKGETV
jgi:hypothetical protein